MLFRVIFVSCVFAIFLVCVFVCVFICVLVGVLIRIRIRFWFLVLLRILLLFVFDSFFCFFAAVKNDGMLEPFPRLDCVHRNIQRLIQCRNRYRIGVMPVFSCIAAALRRICLRSILGTAHICHVIAGSGQRKCCSHLPVFNRQGRSSAIGLIGHDIEHPLIGICRYGIGTVRESAGIGLRGSLCKSTYHL